jgi:hypothetical protein
VKPVRFDRVRVPVLPEASTVKPVRFRRVRATKTPDESTVKPSEFCRLETVRFPDVSAVNTDPIRTPPFNSDIPDTVRSPVIVELLVTAVDNKVANDVPPMNVVDGVPPTDSVPPIDRAPEISTLPVVLTFNLSVFTVIPPLRKDIPCTIRSPEMSELVAVEVLI